MIIHEMSELLFEEHINAGVEEVAVAKNGGEQHIEWNISDV